MSTVATTTDPTAPFSSTHTLYICYFGLREPLVQTQVLPYLRELVGDGMTVSLLTFEPALKRAWSDDQLRVTKAALVAEGLRWYYLPYHKRPSLPATLYDVLAGARLAIRLIRTEAVSMLHARGHVPALIGAFAKRWSGARLIFDIRGFMPEEYTDAGIWPQNGYLYRGVKRVERYLMKSADAFVVLTEKAREILFPNCTTVDAKGRPIEVIPCCIDPSRFRETGLTSRDEIRRKLNLANRRVIAYVGSFGGWYLTEEMMRFMAFAHQQDPGTFFLILTQSPAAPVEDSLRNLGIEKESFFVGKVSPGEVPQYLKAADYSISFIKPSYSKLASSPTKIAEYLASGLPVLSNAGIGDLDELIVKSRVGVIIREFNPSHFAEALTELEGLAKEEGLRDRCQAVADEQFNLITVGGMKYRRLYGRLLSPQTEVTR